MKTAEILAGLLLLGLLQWHLGLAQSPISKGRADGSTKITEPGIIPLSKLLQMSDTVALVRILSGDTENYQTALYKATVVTNFKGSKEGQTLFSGPFIGQRLGFESLVFLRKASTLAVPKKGPNAGYGAVPHLNVFNEGYSSMEISYECGFDGKEIREQCDYGVRVCTDYIVLPKGTETSPPMDEETPFGCRWVRKTAFLSLLNDLTEPGTLPVP
jgi:hypothetical protein